MQAITMTSKLLSGYRGQLMMLLFMLLGYLWHTDKCYFLALVLFLSNLFLSHTCASFYLSSSIHLYFRWFIPRNRFRGRSPSLPLLWYVGFIYPSIPFSSLLWTSVCNLLLTVTSHPVSRHSPKIIMHSNKHPLQCNAMHIITQYLS